jgi:hypothetical protein
MISYLLSPIPFTFLKSSALLNGRASIIFLAVTGPMPGIVLSSFSVAVLMSIFPGAILSSGGCDSVSPGVLVVILAAGAGVIDGTIEAPALDEDVDLGAFFSCGVNTVNLFGFSGRAFSRPILIPPSLRFSPAWLRLRIAEVFDALAASWRTQAV